MTESSPSNIPSQNPVSPAVWAGGGLIVVGILFLVGNLFNIELFQNWWALILTLIGALTLKNAWQAYLRADRQISATVRSQGLVGRFLLLFSFVFLLDLDMGKLWPLMLILIGVMMLFNVPKRASGT